VHLLTNGFGINLKEMHELKKYLTLFALSAICQFIDIHQAMSQSLEVKLDEVRIMGSRKSSYTSDFHTVNIDSLLKTKYFASDLAQILKQETNLNITQYGGHGSLASLRLRGSAPSQTQINWNGIPVNSPTTGSIDVSLLSGGMADAIEIVYGAGGSLFGNGTFGGAINLLNSPDWENRLSFNVAGEAGSWNHYKTGFNVQTGSENFQYHLSGLYQSSPNTYQYKNVFKLGNPIENRLNDSLSLFSFQQHLFLRLPKHWFLQYGAWWQNREKMLPASMSSTPTLTAIQKDQSLRQFLRISKWYGKSTVEFVLAKYSDTLFYGEKLIGSDSILKNSGIRASNLFSSVHNRWFAADKITIETGADLEYQSAKVDAYGGIAKERRGALFGQLKYSANPIAINLSYRQVFYSMTGPRPLFSVATHYKFPGNGLTIKAQVSNKFRYPTLNDRFWKPGGNPNLLPETGVGYDLDLQWLYATTAKSTIKINSLLFLQQVNNWILWLPLGTYWSPQNVRQVKCQGIEVDINGRWNSRFGDFFTKVMYTYTESLDMSRPETDSRLNRQLAYVPFHLVKVQAGFSTRRLEANLGYKFSGRRFTTDNHDAWLDLYPYHIVDFSVGYSFFVRKERIVISGNISNLLNTNYQLIRAYPAPGRSFYLSINYLFNQKSKKHVQI
jgi:vitamin B12 transporter